MFDIRTNSVVGMVATFSPFKDYESYFEAAAIILESLPDVTFVAVGDGENREQLEEIYKKKFPDRVRFVGSVDNVESIIQVFDVGVLASTSFGEGISNAILEYMAMGRPVVATACAGTKELVIDGTTGYLTKVGDSADLAVKIARLLANSQLREEMGLSGLRRARTFFDLSRMSKAYFDLYVHVIGRT
jgi:glycosyltransferase involved in cell wall biosynthesis